MQPSFSEARFLIVDDQAGNVELFEHLLRRAGYRHILGLTDPRTALDEIKAFGPDCLLLDQNMPHLSGLDFLKQLRASQPQAQFLPVIMITASNDETVKKQALAAGANDFLVNPVDATEVALRVGNLLQLRFMTRRLADHNRVLEERVTERTQELEQRQEDALRIVGLTLEYRDYETKGHTDRVTHLALELARALGVDQAALESLRWGSYLHDAGKVAIPDQILLKPGKLDAEEFEVVKQHVTTGEEMLRHLSFLPEEVFHVIRHHHERWDGNGYPDRLRGKDIPLLARVFAVADVYDALISERPYKRAWSHELAVGELQRQRGKHFDPALVDTFVEIHQRD